MRRFVSISLYLLMFTILLLLSPALLLLGLVSDLLSNTAAVRTLLFLLLYLACELLGIAASLAIWLVRVDKNFELQCWWARTLRQGAFKIFSMHAEVEGSDVVTPGPIVMFIRHCSVADTMLPVMLVTDPHRIVLRWVLKKQLLWDPCLDIVGNRMQNVFVSRMPDENARDVAAVATLMDGLGEKDGVVIYPEGTRFTEAKRARLLQKESISALAQRFEHVLPPRLGGALALLDNNADHADVVFCAHAGLEGTATFFDLFKGRVVGQTVHIKLWRVAYEDVPKTRDDRVAWLYDHWQQIDRFIEGVQCG